MSKRIRCTAVRDGLRDDAYRIDLSEHGMKASAALALGNSWCVPKAVQLAAVARAASIPARPHRALAGRRLAPSHATPALTRSLCDNFGLLPLEFAGVNDALHHPFDRAGQRHRAQVNERGSFAEDAAHDRTQQPETGTGPG